MNATTQIKRTFINTNKARYGNAVKRPDIGAQISIHLFDEKDALIGEFSFRWDYIVAGFSLHVYNDAFIAMKACQDLFDHLAEHNDVNFNTLAFCNILKQLGFVDSTPNISPFVKTEQPS